MTDAGAQRRGRAEYQRTSEGLEFDGVAAARLPVAVFAASIPIAFASTTGALSSWLSIFPAERVLDRWKLAAANERFR